MTLIQFEPHRPPPGELVGVVDELLAFARSRLVKASLPATKAAQQQLFAEIVPTFTEELGAYFEAFAERALPVAKAVAFKWDPDDVDWSFEQRALAELFARWYARVGTATYEIVGEQIGASVAFDLNARGVQRVLGSVATRVQGITDTSREAIRLLVDIAIDRGYSVDQLVRGVPGEYGGLRDVVDRWASTAEGGAASRAQTIALTETATAYSRSSVAAYRDSSLIDEVQVLDGPDCGWTAHDDPDLAHGMVVTLDEADEYPIAHPRCQRAFAPVAAR